MCIYNMFLWVFRPIQCIAGVVVVVDAAAANDADDDEFKRLVGGKVRLCAAHIQEMCVCKLYILTHARTQSNLWRRSS